LPAVAIGCPSTGGTLPKERRNDMPKQESPQSRPAERFYYADGKKVPLVPSRSFAAVRAAPGALSGERLAAEMPAIVGRGRVFDLPE
jgi:hypothetical protein